MRRLSRWKRAMMAGGVLAGLVALFLIMENLRGVIALKRWRSEMIAAGEKLTIGEVAPASAAADLKNGAMLVETGKALRDLEKRCPLIQAMPRLVHFTEPGKARLLLDQAAPEYAMPGKTGDWEAFREQLDQGRPLLEKARLVLRQPVAFEFEYEKGVVASFPGSELITFQRWLRSEFIWCLQAGDFAGALDSTQAMAMLARAFESHQTLIGQMLAISLKASLIDMIWSAVQLDGWTDEQLALVRKYFERTTGAASLVRAVETERAFVPIHFGMLRQSAAGRATLLRMQGFHLVAIFIDDNYEPPEPPSEFVIWAQATLWRLAWTGQDEERVLREIQRSLVAVRALKAERNWTASPLSAVVPKKPRTDRKVWRRAFTETLSLAEAVRGATKRTSLIEAQSELCLAALALKRHQRRSGEWPESLEALIPEFLETLPHDWMDGKSLRYRRKEGDTFLLYSVGSDGIDNDGDAQVSEPKKRPSFSTGRDLVWPQFVVE